MRNSLPAVLLLFATLPPAVADRPRNVLLICVDDLKPTIGCYGDAVASTPSIDALAARGVRFDAAYCNQAVCAPSRNALMTGLRPDTIGVYDLATNFRRAMPDLETMGQRFQGRGYEVISLGKIYHRGHGQQPDGASFSEPPWYPRVPTYAGRDSRRQVEVVDGRRRGPSTESADVSDDTYADGRIADEAIRRLKAFAENPDTPFFLGVGFVRPHLPFVAPRKYWQRYDPATLPMPATIDPPADAPRLAMHNIGELRSYTDIDVPPPGDDDDSRHLIHGYYAATSYVDAQLGRVIASLDELGLASETVIVLWGDHGWHLGDHGLWCKHTNFEQAARIPLIVVDPATPGAAGTATGAMIETVDLYPTLCELTGGEIPGDIDGRSQAAVLRDRSASVRDHVRHVYPRRDTLGVATRDDRYRLVRWHAWTGGDPRAVELYDYEADPAETRNIAADHADVVAKLAAIEDSYPTPRIDFRRTDDSNAPRQDRPRKNPRRERQPSR